MIALRAFKREVEAVTPRLPKYWADYIQGLAATADRASSTSSIKAPGSGLVPNRGESSSTKA